MSSSQQQLNESALACQARDGSKDALAKLLDSNWPWLKGLVYNVLKDADATNDCLQNICVVVIQKISQLREPERFKPWLGTVARNTALDYRQKLSRAPMQLDELLAAEKKDDNVEKALDQLERKEKKHEILDAVKELPEKYREVFILKHINDMSYAQIADVLEITITTVQIRLVRARKMIQNRLAGKTNTKVPRT